MTWLAGWTSGLWSNIFIIGLSDSHIFHPAPSTSLQYWSYLSVYLHTASIIYHPAQSLRPRQDNVDVLLVTSQSVSQSNISTQPSVPCFAHTASLLHLLLGLSAKLFTNWQNFWIIFHPDWEWSHIWQGWLASPISLIFRKFLLLQILINFHGVIPGVLGIFYYNWSLFHVEENIWISKIPSDTHPHPGLIWYLETYPSITV